MGHALVRKQQLVAMVSEMTICRCSRQLHSPMALTYLPGINQERTRSRLGPSTTLLTSYRCCTQ
jgi:hypothetical protein